MLSCIFIIWIYTILTINHLYIKHFLTKKEKITFIFSFLLLTSNASLIYVRIQERLLIRCLKFLRIIRKDLVASPVYGFSKKSIASFKSETSFSNFTFCILSSLSCRKLFTSVDSDFSSAY